MNSRKPLPSKAPSALVAKHADQKARVELRQEIGEGWLPELEDIAMRSPVFLDLLRQHHETGGGCNKPLYSLNRLWEAAGSPPRHEPQLSYQPGPQRDSRNGIIIGRVVKRGKAGLFADWDTAVWYMHQLDPEKVDIDVAIELGC